MFETEEMKIRKQKPIRKSVQNQKISEKSDALDLDSLIGSEFKNLLSDTPNENQDLP